MLFRCVWYFHFACFNMTVVKNLMKKYPFMMYFQNAYAVSVLYNFFVWETLFRKMMALYRKFSLCAPLGFAPLGFFKPE